MQYTWEFFEELNEMVYVSKVETNELVYMNAYLRGTLGFTSHEDYAGKSCYEVLQGRDSPCPFCNNADLEPGKFLTWTHKNPVMNKTVLLKDSIILHENEKYRIEIAIDMDTEASCPTPYYYARGESILNGCIQQLFSTTDPEESIHNMLSYISEIFSCDRSYLFEIDESCLMSNTYEYCKEGVVPQIDLLQKEPIKCLDWWMDTFEENKVVVIEDLESIRIEHPETYAILKPRNISTLVVGPICVEERVLGFIGVDNPDANILPLIGPFLNVIGYFAVSLLRRRDLVKRLNTLSFHDPLTGVYNRNAMFEHQADRMKMRSMGVIYCDITGLKRTNDTMGHDAGDKMICHCCNLIRDVLQSSLIYRIGGDEFLCVCPDCEHDEFQTLVETLHKRIQQDKHHIAVGHIWSDQKPFDLEMMISRADKIMYEDKRRYYAQKAMIPGIDRRRPVALPREGHSSTQNPFQKFLSTSYWDAETFFQAVVQQNPSGYFYFGDMQKDLFYISDNMRSEYGFESNVVPGMLRTWSQHISSPKLRERYWNDIDDMLKEKRTIHDLHYQVSTANGDILWVNSYGVLKWNDDKTIPLFFAGRVSFQNNKFLVDPVTNFPTGSVLISRLQKFQDAGEPQLIIGFRLNNMEEINNFCGRIRADRLIKNVAAELIDGLSDKMSFYRLDGMCCVALVEKQCIQKGQEMVQQIREVIEGCYSEMGIHILHACSFGLMRYPCANMNPEDFLDHMVALIKVAKYEPNRAYMDYSATGAQQIRYMSKMSLILSQDVMNEMEHFRIVIQPVVDAKDGRIIGGEVLLRWSFEGKDISPSIFVPMLEKENIIHLVGRWIVEQAVRNCARLICYDPEFYLTFNVSLRQLADIRLTDIMKETLEKYHLDGSHLVVETTESYVDEQPEILACFIDQCNDMGIRIALDDFGSGYSSLQMLLRYPYNIVKLDRSLLEEITHSDKKLQFVRSIVYACHQFGIKVCMEGVETEHQNAIIREAGCDIIQGYYHYPPMELSALYSLFSDML